jgi:hypothetical protein
MSLSLTVPTGVHFAATMLPISKDTFYGAAPARHRDLPAIGLPAVPARQPSDEVGIFSPWDPSLGAASLSSCARCGVRPHAPGGDDVEIHLHHHRKVVEQIMFVGAVRVEAPARAI